MKIHVDKGEASAIALALETSECTIIIDDWKARKLAEHLGLNVTGTIGIIIKAKNSNLITSIKPYLEKIKATNFRISEELEYIALQEANEL